MQEQELILDHLDGIFRDLESRLNGATGSARHNFHKKSFETLRRVRFPDRKNEDWKYTSIHQLMDLPWALAGENPSATLPNIPGLNSLVVPVNNGRLMVQDIDPAIAEAGIKIITHEELFENVNWRSHFGEQATAEESSASRAFELLNKAFATNAFFIEIPTNTRLAQPIELRFIHDDPVDSLSNPCYYILGGSGCDVTFFERYESGVTSANALINALGRIYLEPNAIVRFVRWQELSNKQHLVYTLHAIQQRDSRFEMLSFDHGGKVVRNTIETDLLESNTFTSLESGYTAYDHQAIDHQTIIHHKVPHCESHELYRGILDGKAKAAFNGKVFVSKDAQKTNAYQQNDTLVLSPFALMNSKPQLEIYADDVRCSHGATIGQLDERSVFYLRARGISEKDAITMLKSAFLDVVLDKVKQDALREYIHSRMTDEL